MTPAPPKLPERDERLGEILAAWIEAEERGETPDRADWLARHPAFAAELEEFLANRDRLLAEARSLCRELRRSGATPRTGDTPHSASEGGRGEQLAGLAG